jgi:hypothetical protein
MARAAQAGDRSEERKGNRINARPPRPAPKTGNARRLAGEKVNGWTVTR